MTPLGKLLRTKFKTPDEAFRALGIDPKEVSAAGSDVVVGDSQLKPGDTSMATAQQLLSRKALFAKGALLVALPSMLAADAKPTFAKDLHAALLGVASDNWKKTGKAKIVAAFKGKLAKDATPAALNNLLDSLDTEDPMDGNANLDEKQVPIDQIDPDAAKKEGEGEAEDGETPEEKEAREKAAGVKAATTDAEDDDLSTLSPEHMEIIKAVVAALKGAGAAKDEPPKGITPPPAKGETKINQQEGRSMKEGIGKAAMDAAISKAVSASTAAAVAAATTKIRADMRAVAEAEEDVRPFVGKLAIACDSADDVYKAALDALGVNVDGVHPSAFRHLLKAQRRPADTGGVRPALRLASDSSMDNFAEQFPEASRIRFA